MTAPVSRATTLRSDEVAFAHKQMSENITSKTGSLKSEDVELQNIKDDHAEHTESYFAGPRDLAHHSRWPGFLQLHGSVMPRMILPLFFVAAWSTAITCISEITYDIGIPPTLLTVLGFVVGLSLSFRSSTAYERYNDGRKYWAQLATTTQSLARLVWIHAEEREDHKQEDLLAKISFCNMLVTFSVALKHRLRFEPFTHYQDLEPRLRHVKIIAQEAERRDFKEPSFWKRSGLVLGLPMAESNPRKLIKNPKKPLGNIPLETLTYASAYIKGQIDNATLKAPAYQTQAMNFISTLHDVLSGTDRVVNTPLPMAYSIAISQITWVYILILPFQLTKTLNWVTIPATVFAAYIILGISVIGREIENPFGEDVNDLPLDTFCEQIRRDIDIIMCQAPATVESFMERDDNAVLHPFSNHGFNSLKEKSVEEIRTLLQAKSDLVSSRVRAQQAEL